MGSRRVGLARSQSLIQNLKRELSMTNSTLTGLKGLAGSPADTVSAAGTAALLTEALICKVDSASDTDKVKMFPASYPGQICIIINIDSAQDAVVRDVADSGTLATLGQLTGCILVASATGDNWYLCGQ